MAYVGLAKPTVAKLDESAGTPKYTDGFTCGKAMALDISPQYAEGSLFADNKKLESDKEFKYADVTLGTDTLPIQAHKVMFGHEVSKEGESGTSIKNRTTDSSNYVGLGIYMDEKVDGLKKYVAMWIYKVKFAEGQDSFKTKGDNIEYQTPSIGGQAIGIDDNLWKETRIYDTEKEAQDWIDEMAGIKQAQTPEGGGESGSGGGSGEGEVSGGVDESGKPGGDGTEDEGTSGGTAGGESGGEETGGEENGGETV